MDNLAATYRYRASVVKAIAHYQHRLKTIWEFWGEPVPVTQDCASHMIEAYAELRIAWRKADLQLQKDRAHV